MCGRYQIAAEDDIIEMREILDEISKRYKSAPEAVAAVKTGEACPTDTSPVLIQGKQKPQAVLMKWGFPKQGGGVIINARAETAEEKPTFRLSLESRRCVVPTVGFFEWRQEGGRKKTKYLFRLPGAKMLYLAGLYGVFQDGPRSWAGYVVLTSPANASVSPYHDRMPLVLMPDEIGPWLTDTAFAQAFVQRPCAVMLEAIPV
jgi:putative SOS response-associated peptidase YedK